MNPFLARIQDRPLAVAPTRAAWFEACMKELTASDKPMPAASINDDFWDERYDWARPYNVVNGVLQIPIKGALLHDFPYQLGSYCTGYEYVTEAVRRGVEDGNVQGIALMVDSPGGMVAGLWDAVDRISALKTIGGKPMNAFVENCYSAAFALSSVADNITVTRSGGVGSVGVVMMHFDVSKAMADAGVKVTYIFAGAHKVDGNAYEALPADVKARWQAEIDVHYEEFVAAVATNRGLTPEAVKATEAQCFMPAEALAVGFADQIGPMDESFSAFVASFDESQTGVYAMADKAEAITQSAFDAAVASARADGDKAGRTAERERVAAILGSDEAKVRPSAAQMLAFDTDKDADAAKVMLGKLPAETKPEAAKSEEAPKGAGVPAPLFTAAMDNTANPNLSAEQGADAPDSPEARRAARSALIRSSGIGGFRNDADSKTTH